MNINNKETVILFVGENQYEVLTDFTIDIAQSFIQFGYDVEIINLIEPTAANQLVTTINTKKIAFFFSMNAIGHGLKTNDQSLYDALNIPFFAFLVDHPMYMLHRITDIKNLIVSCVDTNHVDFLNKYIDSQCTKIFIPHGATINDQFIHHNIKSIKEREFDLLFTGSYNDFESYRKNWKSYDEKISNLFDTIMENALYQNSSSVIEIAENIFIDRGIDTDNITENALYLELLWDVDRYIRFRRRYETLNSLSSLDIRFEVFGNGWENVRFKGNSIRLNPPIIFEVAQEKMANSKMVLGVLPNFINGGHERIFNTMINGSVSLVDENPYINKTFDNQKHLITYKWKDNLEEIVLNGLDDDNKLQNIANQSREITLSNHTWLLRSKEIIETVKRHKEIR